VPIVLKSVNLSLLETSGPVQACNGIALPLPGVILVHRRSVASYIGKQIKEKHLFDYIWSCVHYFYHNSSVIYPVINIRLHLSRTLQFETVAAGIPFHLVQPNIYLSILENLVDCQLLVKLTLKFRNSRIAYCIGRQGEQSFLFPVYACCLELIKKGKVKF